MAIILEDFIDAIYHLPLVVERGDQCKPRMLLWHPNLIQFTLGWVCVKAIVLFLLFALARSIIWLTNIFSIICM
ncbi:hypothetical protein AXW37_08785 [Yersinia ruckeri]|nr:hypothetical protein BI323_03985 [Yersinia ruckeri]OIX45511.1 hypothetical protein AXW22_08570 [Yersinia ruckeri]OJB67318.1 hypothetical protein A9Q65_08560 [Yersinia ruckeri]OJB69309.1 hypothetical protein A9Q64_08575 [Yersinia ruckeri]OJB71086.1 hypothetical protein A9Q63_08550 [Yersinia ruckeri]